MRNLFSKPFFLPHQKLPNKASHISGALSIPIKTDKTVLDESFSEVTRTKARYKSAQIFLLIFLDSLFFCSNMFLNKLFILLFAAPHLIVAQQCIFDKKDYILTCWGWSSNANFSDIHFEKAKTLQIKSSNFTQLSAKFFERFEVLEKLTMSRNAIQTVTDDAFRKLEHLKYLNLSYNEIDYLDSMTFVTNTRLAGIDLSGNHLRVFNMDVFKDLPLLETFYLAGNPIDFCETNTHFALLELKYRNIDTHIELKPCEDYYELVPRNLQIQLAQLLYYLSIFNSLSVLLFAAVLVAFLALMLQSRQTGGWRFPLTNLISLKYDRLRNLPETKIPQTV